MRKLLIMTALLFGFSLAPVMGSPVGAQETASSVAADLDGWWAGQLSASGYGYWSPGIVEVWGYQETACGPIDTGIGPAAYCPVDGTIYVVPGYGYGTAEWTTILAHEWGHHIQRLLGQGGYPTEAGELQADCFGGAYVRSAELRGIIPQGTGTRGMSLSIRAGELTFLPDDMDIHGTGSERGGSFMSGYMNGFGACL